MCVCVCEGEPGVGRLAGDFLMKIKYQKKYNSKFKDFSRTFTYFFQIQGLFQVSNGFFQIQGLFKISRMSGNPVLILNQINHKIDQIYKKDILNKI